MTLTKQLLHPAGSNGHNAKQLAVLGVKWPPAKGWLKKLIGTQISEERYAEFVSLGRRRIKETKAEGWLSKFDHTAMMQCQKRN